MPTVSVIIPTYNGETMLAEQLDSLLAQTVPADEVVIADNGSSDNTVALARSYADRLSIVLVDASARRGNAAARNLGVRGATANTLLFLDQDDRADERWIESMLKDFDGGLVVGRNVMVRDWEAGPPPDTGRASAPSDGGFLPYGLSNNMGMDRATFDALGGFDERYAAATDVDICWRAQHGGVTFAQAQDAVVFKRRKETLRGGFRQHVDFGVDDVQLFLSHRPHGMTRPWRRTGRQLAWLATRLPSLRGVEARQDWVRVAGHMWGRVVGSVRFRTVYI